MVLDRNGGGIEPTRAGSSRLRPVRVDSVRVESTRSGVNSVPSVVHAHETSNIYIRYGLLKWLAKRIAISILLCCARARPRRMSKSNENQPQPGGRPLLGDPSSPQLHAEPRNAKQALVDPARDARDPSFSDEKSRSSTPITDAMAYSAPSRYAGVLIALEALRVDLETAPLPALLVKCSYKSGAAC